MPNAEVLVVVPHLPQPDTCAGDWRVYRLCRILADEFRVFLLPASPCSPADIPVWKAWGVDVLIPGDNAPATFPELLQQHVFSSVIFEWFHTAHHFLKYLPLCPRIIIDTHELYYMKARRMQSVLGSHAIKPGYPDEIRSSELSLYRTADLLLAVSSEEAAALRAEFPHKQVMVLPLLTDTDGPCDLSPFEERKDLVFFGSFQNPGQSPNTDAVRYFADTIMPEVKRSLPDVSFHVAGFGSEALIMNTVHGDGAIEDFHSYLGRFRVFVCPLRFGAGLKKKVLDAAISGCPLITTSVGNEGTGFVDGQHVLVADDPADFARAVVRLYSDPELWNRLAQAARTAALENSGSGILEFKTYLRAL